MTHIDRTSPEIDYLAKDYASFRRLMLDYLSRLAPDWKEQNSSDLGMALVEVLAYAADYLSYYQDAVATEAYLGTARLRRSVRRHVRLLEYYMEEGCNARAWVHIQLKAPNDTQKRLLFLPVLTQLWTRLPNYNAICMGKNEAAYHQVQREQIPVFETMHPISLLPEHNAFYVLPVRDGEYCLPRGSTRARLAYTWKPGEDSPEPLRPLKKGDVLVFEEQFDQQRDAAPPDHRHAVRLTGVHQKTEATSNFFEVQWDAADSLPFDLLAGPDASSDPNSSLSIALGNIVLADHGQTIQEELPVVEPDQRYRSRLSHPDLTFSVPFDPNTAKNQPAYQATHYRPYQAYGWVRLKQYAANFAQRKKRSRKFRLLQVVPDDLLSLHSSNPGEEIMAMQYNWTVRRDLLNSGPFDRDFQVEMEEGRWANLRFGFEGAGKQPDPGDRFLATYRVGNGVRGNVGIDTIAHIFAADQEMLEHLKERIQCIRNPMPARGGSDPETIESARQHAPYAFHVPKGCVTPADYVRVAGQHPAVLRARAHTHDVRGRQRVVISVQRAHGLPVDEKFREELLELIEPFRLIGHEVVIEGPSYVPIHVHLRILRQPGAAAANVQEELRLAFSDQEIPGGSPGFFYPDHFTFGQSLHQSQVIHCAMNVPGVKQVDVIHFRREDSDADRLEIPIGPGEIAQLKSIQLDVEGSA